MKQSVDKGRRCKVQRHWMSSGGGAGRAAADQQQPKLEARGLPRCLALVGWSFAVAQPVQRLCRAGEGGEQASGGRKR